MAKKAELLEEAKKLGLEVAGKNTVAEINAAIDKARSEQKAAEPIETNEDAVESNESTAKAGKRSAKALAEAEEKQAKEERKAAAKAEATDSKPKIPIKPARSRIERRSKKFQESAKLVDRSKDYSLTEAMELACKTSTVKFDATVELHIRLGVDPRQADQNIRDMVVLPAGTGKTVRIVVFAEEDNAKKAIAAGADFAGNEELLEKLDKGVVDFDVLIATPNLMAKLAKYARVLGPKGLMPNPKSGTVTADVAKAIQQAKAGRIEYRVDSTGIVHVGAGKVSFGASKLETNAQAIFASIKQNKPASLKGIYVRSISVSTTMGPGIKVQPSAI